MKCHLVAGAKVGSESWFGILGEMSGDAYLAQFTYQHNENGN